MSSVYAMADPEHALNLCAKQYKHPLYRNGTNPTEQNHINRYSTVLLTVLYCSLVECCSVFQIIGWEDRL